MDEMISVAKAETALRDHWSDLHPEDVREKVMLLTDDKDAAQLAFSRRTIEYQYQKQAKAGV